MKLIKIDKLEGSIRATPSKSESIRALAIASLSGKITNISNLSDSIDSIAALNCIRALGTKVSKVDAGLEVIGKCKGIENEMDCRESGLCFRLFPVIASNFNKSLKLKRSGSLLKRDISELISSLELFGISCISNDLDGSIEIKSSIKSGNYKFSIHDTSQVLSGILIALTQAEHDSTLQIENMVSSSYVDLTIEYLNKFGLIVEKSVDNLFFIKGNQQINPCNIRINGDWSGSAFLLVGAAISGEIEIEGLDLETAQGDKIIYDILKSTQAQISSDTSKQSINVSSSMTTSFDFDAIHNPDLVMPLCLLGLHSEGISYIRNVQRIVNKESNRLENIINEFKKLKGDIKLIDNTLVIRKSKLESAKVSSHNDHRLAMTFAIASLFCDNPIEIDNFECVDKSYPEFWNHLLKLGAKIYE